MTNGHPYDDPYYDEPLRRPQTFVERLAKILSALVFVAVHVVALAFVFGIVGALALLAWETGWGLVP